MFYGNALSKSHEAEDTEDDETSQDTGEAVYCGKDDGIPEIVDHSFYR